MRCIGLVLPLALFIAACGSSTTSGTGGPPVNVAGSYTIAVTDEDNGCQLANWMMGQSSSGIPLQITQSGANATGNVSGLVGVAIALWLGSATFQGTVSGNEIDITDYGSTKTTTGMCTYSINAIFHGTLDGDALSGSVTYTTVTNHASDCGFRETCASHQNLSGSRPPM
jgi:hypothetical protein